MNFWCKSCATWTEGKIVFKNEEVRLTKCQICNTHTIADKNNPEFFESMMVIKLHTENQK